MKKTPTEADVRRAYARGYNNAVAKRWHDHKPAIPPIGVVRELMLAASKLRDSADGFCATLDNDDPIVNELGPGIDAVDDAMRRVTAYLIEDEPNTVAVNPPFERVPQHAWDPGHGPVPPKPKECTHKVSTKFPCPDCNTVSQLVLTDQPSGDA